MAIDTSSLQFESDEIMRRAWGDDGAIACCVSPMLVGKQMQFFGARANLAKCLLYAINGGRDEISGEQIGPGTRRREGRRPGVRGRRRAKFERMMDWLAGVYVNAMNVIHYMHDKYTYERLEMALHDYAPLRTMAFGMAGLSVVADSLSAIKHATVKVIRDDDGPRRRTTRRKANSRSSATTTTGWISWRRSWVVTTSWASCGSTRRTADALHTQSVLTITSNVVYGKKTGNTPDGRRRGRAVRPGREPDARSRHATASMPRRPRWPRSRTATPRTGFR